MDAVVVCGLPFLDAILVALCWVPPVLGQKAKIALTLVFLGSLALVGLPNPVAPLLFVWANLTTLVLAVLTFFYVVVRVQRNHCRREPLDEPHERAGDIAAQVRAAAEQWFGQAMPLAHRRQTGYADSSIQPPPSTRVPS
jgi:hypothetical protein